MIDNAAKQRVHDAASDNPWKQALATALADVKARLSAADNSQRDPLFTDATELFGRTFTTKPWLVTGLVARGGTTLIVAEPKSGKTWFALELALAVATGTKVAGEFFAEHGRAAYFFAEDLDVQVRNRLRALLAGQMYRSERMPVDRLHVCPRGKFLDVIRDEDLAWIVASVRQLGGTFDLLVLDPLRDIHSGEEDKSDSMRDVMRRLRVIGELLGCTVAVTHHKSKSNADTAKRRSGQQGRGSSAIHGSTDSGIYLSLVGGDGVAEFEIAVDVEIKGGRSAGRFDLGIKITDDSEGAATRAALTVSRGQDRDTSADDAADEMAVIARVRDLADSGHAPLSKTALRDSVKGVADGRVRRAISRLLGKRLALRDVEHDGRLLKDRVVAL